MPDQPQAPFNSTGTSPIYEYSHKASNSSCAKEMDLSYQGYSQKRKQKHLLQNAFTKRKASVQPSSQKLGKSVPYIQE
jgi:hypothetical protein